MEEDGNYVIIDRFWNEYLKQIEQKSRHHSLFASVFTEVTRDELTWCHCGIKKLKIREARCVNWWSYLPLSGIGLTFWQNDITTSMKCCSCCFRWNANTICLNTDELAEDQDTSTNTRAAVRFEKKTSLPTGDMSLPGMHFTNMA